MKTVETAMHDTAHDYPGGAAALAVVLGKNPTTLANECNPNCTTHKLGLAEAVRMMRLSNDHQILRAMCHALGYLDPIPRVDSDLVPDLELLDLLAQTFTEGGEVARSLSGALADGDINRKEFRDIEARCMAAQSAFANLLERVRSMVIERPSTAARGR